jgi:hypothetical protein
MSDTDGKDDLWQRLRELAHAFAVAVYAGRSEELDNMSVILYALDRFPEFRKTAYSAARKRIEDESSRRKRSTIEAGPLLASMKSAIEAHEADPTKVAHAFVTFLSAFPSLYLLAPDAPPMVGNNQDAYDDAVRRVAEEITPTLTDPDAVNPESVIKAAMRALGAKPSWVKDMFQSS